jgi:hypothetical protein
MKVKINRALVTGQYRVSFEVGDFSLDEAEKMAKFGVPRIPMMMLAGGSMTNRQVGITQINGNLVAIFTSSKEAADYEKSVLAALRAAIDGIRSQKDTFSSAEEVDI